MNLHAHSSSAYTISSVSAADGGVYECGVACENASSVFSNQLNITSKSERTTELLSEWQVPPPLNCCCCSWASHYSVSSCQWEQLNNGGGDADSELQGWRMACPGHHSEEANAITVAAIVL